jgi:hypothetical protein
MFFIPTPEGYRLEVMLLITEALEKYMQKLGENRDIVKHNLESWPSPDVLIEKGDSDHSCSGTLPPLHPRIHGGAHPLPCSPFYGQIDNKGSPFSDTTIKDNIPPMFFNNPMYHG